MRRSVCVALIAAGAISLTGCEKQMIELVAGSLLGFDDDYSESFEFISEEIVEVGYTDSYVGYDPYYEYEEIYVDPYVDVYYEEDYFYDDYCYDSYDWYSCESTSGGWFY